MMRARRGRQAGLDRSREGRRKRRISRELEGGRSD